MTITKKQLLKVGTGSLQLLIAFILYAVLETLYLKAALAKLTISSLIVPILFTLALSALTVTWYRKKLAKENTRNLNLAPHWKLKRLLWPLLGVAAIFLIQMIAGFLTNNLQPSNQAAITQVQKLTNPIFNVLLVAIAPFFEEIIFRGIFFNYFFTNLDKKSSVLGIVTNGLLFGFCHESNLISIPFVTYALCGSILAAVYLKTKDLRYSYLCHFGNNLLALIL